MLDVRGFAVFKVRVPAEQHANLQDLPIRAWHEHTREVFSVDWSNIQKDIFASSSWDGNVKLVCNLHAYCGLSQSSISGHLIVRGPSPHLMRTIHVYIKHCFLPTSPTCLRLAQLMGHSRFSTFVRLHMQLLGQMSTILRTPSQHRH